VRFTFVKRQRGLRPPVREPRRTPTEDRVLEADGHAALLTSKEET